MIAVLKAEKRMQAVGNVTPVTEASSLEERNWKLTSGPLGLCKVQGGFSCSLLGFSFFCGFFFFFTGLRFLKLKYNERPVLY